MNLIGGSGLCQIAKFSISDIEFRDSVTKVLVPCFTHVMYPLLKITPDSSVSEMSIPWIEIIIISVQVFSLLCRIRKVSAARHIVTG